MIASTIIIKDCFNGGITIKKINEQSNLIILRNTQENDLDFIINIESQPENAQFVLQWSEEQHKGALMNEDILHLVVEDKETQKLVGYVIVAGLKNSDRNIELKRITISEKGKGYGREAIKLIRKISFEDLNGHRLWLDAICKNHRAQKLYESEGFVREGILRKCMFINGKYESIVVMSILEDEYMECPFKIK